MKIVKATIFKTIGGVLLTTAAVAAPSAIASSKEIELNQLKEKNSKLKNTKNQSKPKPPTQTHTEEELNLQKQVNKLNEEIKDREEKLKTLEILINENQNLENQQEEYTQQKERIEKLEHWIKVAKKICEKEPNKNEKYCHQIKAEEINISLSYR